MAGQEQYGWVRLTSSGVVGDSAKAQTIAGYTIESGGGGAAAPYFLNGSSGTGALAFRADNSTGGASQFRTTTIPSVTLASGCYVSFDGNTAALTVFYSQALT